MGGTIGFSTITGQGTTFYFELPRADQALQAPQFPALIDTARYRVPAFASNPPAPVDGTGLPRILACGR